MPLLPYDLHVSLNLWGSGRKRSELSSHPCLHIIAADGNTCFPLFKNTWSSSVMWQDDYSIAQRGAQRLSREENRHSICIRTCTHGGWQGIMRAQTSTHTSSPWGAENLRNYSKNIQNIGPILIQYLTEWEWEWIPEFLQLCTLHQQSSQQTERALCSHQDRRETGFISPLRAVQRLVHTVWCRQPVHTCMYGQHR